MTKREYYLIAAVLLASAAALPQSSVIGNLARGLCGFFAILYAYGAGSLK